MLALLIGTGILLTIATRGVQFRKFLLAGRQVLGLDRPSTGGGAVSGYKALATSLSATVGVGNLAGIPIAITIGGPGAIFWLFVAGLFGMATKFAEIAIALHFREKDPNGEMRGGAMYVLAKGVPDAVVRIRVRGAVRPRRLRHRHSDPGQQRGGRDAGFLRCPDLGDRLGAGRCHRGGRVGGPAPHCRGGFGARPRDVRHLRGVRPVRGYYELERTPGRRDLGAGLGVPRARRGWRLRGGGCHECHPERDRQGLLSNEAGLGSAPIVHAAAVTDHAIRQATFGIFGVFVDTIVVCMLTASTVLLTGAWTSGLEGLGIAAHAFQEGLPGAWGGSMVSVAVALFGLSTILGWAYYGETGFTYLFGVRGILFYQIAWSAMVFVGAIGGLQAVWDVTDTMNALMAIPNLFAVLGSVGLLRKLLREFFPPNG